MQFKKALLANGGKRSAERSARATVYSRLNQLEAFFKWLAEQPGYRSRFKISDANYFHLPRRDVRIAQEREGKPAPTLDEIRAAIESMPAQTDVELRNRAVMAFLILSGARVNAVRTFKLRHLRRDRLGIRQDARDVRTKGSKTFTTFFFPLGDNLQAMFDAYVDHLRGRLGWTDADPLFPATAQSSRPGQVLQVVGLERDHWKTADPVRSICRRAFEGAHIPYYSPHSFRRTLALIAQDCCRTTSELKAWSQNLGHDQLLTTLTSYGTLPETRQAELVRGTTLAPASPVSPEMHHFLQRLLIETLADKHGGTPRNLTKEDR